MLISRVGRSRALRDQLVAAIRLRVVGLDRYAGVGKPVRRIFRRSGDGCGRDLGSVVELQGGGGGRRRLAQVVGRLSLGLRPDRRGLSAQRLDQVDRIARHVFACERLDLSRARGARRQKDEANSQ